MIDDRPGDAAPVRAPTHALLVASVAVRQAGTRTAQVAGRMTVRAAQPDQVHALVATFLHADTAAAANALGGSFHREVARVTTTGREAGLVNSALTSAF